MDSNVLAQAKNVGTGGLSDTPHIKKCCCGALFVWLFGGVLAAVPIGIVFILKPVNELKCTVFFGDLEIIYTAITMAVVALCNSVRKIGVFLLAFYILAIITGTIVYALLKSGVKIPVLADGRLYLFNIYFLCIVVVVGLITHINVYLKNGGQLW